MIFDPRGRPTVVIIVFAHVVLSSVRPNFSKQFQAKTMFALGETVGLAEWIIDDTCIVIHIFDFSIHKVTYEQW